MTVDRHSRACLIAATACLSTGTALLVAATVADRASLASLWPGAALTAATLATHLALAHCVLTLTVGWLRWCGLVWVLAGLVQAVLSPIIRLSHTQTPDMVFWLAGDVAQPLLLLWMVGVGGRIAGGVWVWLVSWRRGWLTMPRIAVVVIAVSGFTALVITLPPTLFAIEQIVLGGWLLVLAAGFRRRSRTHPGQSD